LAAHAHRIEGAVFFKSKNEPIPWYLWGNQTDSQKSIPQTPNADQRNGKHSFT